MINPDFALTMSEHLSQVAVLLIHMQTLGVLRQDYKRQFDDLFPACAVGWEIQ